VAAMGGPSSVTPYPPAPLGSPYAPALDHEPMDTGMSHDAYPTPGSFVHAPLTAHVGVQSGPGPVGGNAYANVGAGDWSVGGGNPGGGDRPNIRPPVPSPLSQSGGPGNGGAPGNNRRSASGNNMPLPSGDDLGIEESEYDTPAYLRRSRGGAGAHDYAAMSYRMPEK
jgi:hypothetical protein